MNFLIFYLINPPREIWRAVRWSILEGYYLYCEWSWYRKRFVVEWLPTPALLDIWIANGEIG